MLHKIFNFLPPFKGKLRLASLLFNKSKTRKFRTIKGIHYIVPNLTENVSLELFINGFYERATIDFISGSIIENGIFVDVGANVGAICLEVARNRPDVIVYAFEASPFVFDYLKMNKALNELENLYVFNIAIHEKSDAELPFYSLPSANGKGSFSPVFTEVFCKVRTVRLDDFFNSLNVKPNFIKCDVEGYELLVFKSLVNLHGLENITLLFEFVDWTEELANFDRGSAQDFLLQNGFELTALSSKRPITKAMTKGDEMIIARKS